MPLIALAPPAPPTPAPKREGQRKHILWVSPSGDEIDLSDTAAGYVSVPGRSGLGMVPREVVYDQQPDGGATLRTIRDLPRVVHLPLRVHGKTADEYVSRLRRLQVAFRHPIDPVTGVPRPGRLVVVMPDGSSRSLRAYYHGGLDAEEDPLDDLILRSQTFPELEFIALDPYWSGGMVTSPTWRVAAGTVAWFGGPFPRVLAASHVLGGVSIQVPGDAPCYPVWTIRGPGVPVIRNETTGREWRFKATAEIPAGRTVTVDTRPGVLTVEDDQGNNWFSNLEQWPDLWALEPGVNEITVEMSGATRASFIRFEAEIRWQSGW